MVTTVRLPVDLRSVATARTLLHDALAAATGRSGGSQPVARAAVEDDAAVMLSELVTNSVRHTSRLLEVEIRIQADTLYVAVTDDSPQPPALRPEDPDAAGGRGMRIIDSLADLWGYAGGACTKTVWFQIALR